MVDDHFYDVQLSSQDTGEILMPQDMKKYQIYAGRKISFENEEVAEMKKFDTSGLTLMGFKPASRLKRYFHVKPAQFLYPDETVSLRMGWPRKERVGCRNIIDRIPGRIRS